MKATVTVTYQVAIEVEVPPEVEADRVFDWLIDHASEKTWPIWEALEGLPDDCPRIEWVMTSATDENDEEIGGVS